MRKSSVSRKVSRKSPAPARRLTLKRAAPPQVNPDELRDLEQISRRYEQSELAWLRMTAPPEGDETWTKVEEHLLANARGSQDQERRWKYFSK